MGTNYYWGDTHLGKTSALPLSSEPNYAFTWAADPVGVLCGIHEIADAVIEDEYGKHLTPDEFRKIVWDAANQYHAIGHEFS